MNCNVINKVVMRRTVMIVMSKYGVSGLLSGRTPESVSASNVSSSADSACPFDINTSRRPGIAACHWGARKWFTALNQFFGGSCDLRGSGVRESSACDHRVIMRFQSRW